MQATASTQSAADIQPTPNPNAAPKLKVPYCVSNFEQIRTEGYYYVDKTHFIPLLERYLTPMFMRPRRFGKTLFVYTLEAYYDRTRANRFEELFKGTYIYDHPTPRQGKHITLHLNFSSVQCSDQMDKLENNFDHANLIAIRHTVNANRDIMPDFSLPDNIHSTAALISLLGYIADHNLPSLYLLIDEYDNFTNQLVQSNKDTLYVYLTTGDSFMRTFFKAVKDGIEKQTIATCYCTGVLPITVDDMTSGFNIANILTLLPEFHDMAGFTHTEARRYLDYLIENYVTDRDRLGNVWNTLLDNYDGYRFHHACESIFNSTILSHFFIRLEQTGQAPEEMIDTNVNIDPGWIGRLAATGEEAREMLDMIVNEEDVGYNQTLLKKSFSRETFLTPGTLPVSLFYQGLLTIVDRIRMRQPNLTTKVTLARHYVKTNGWKFPTTKYLPWVDRFLKEGDLQILFDLYLSEMLRHIPAQAFDKVNENFVRTMFFCMCDDWLSGDYTFAIESNLPNGRSDFLMVGRPGGAFPDEVRAVEFKYFKTPEAERLKALAADPNGRPDQEDIDQILRYAADVREKRRGNKVRPYVAYICANEVAKCWEV